MISSLFKEGFNFLREGLAPSQCAGCEKFGTWLCEDCREAVVFILRQTCPYCPKTSAGGQVCSWCRKQSSLDGLYVVANLNMGPLRRLMHKYKYDGTREIERELLSVMRGRTNLGAALAYPLVVSVPLHGSRQRKRGFNQAEILARTLAMELDIGYLNALMRIRGGHPQVGLDKLSRRESLAGAFRIKYDISGWDIVLVDDIATTGATLEECARVLKANGARRVWGWVLARGKRDGSEHF